ncbi:MAG: deoxyribodipyrimidine photo-lyase [Ginsengibacter sp.]
MKSINIFWFRRDLRLHDNAGLYYALKQNFPVIPIFIFDKHILDVLEDKADRRVNFIYNAIIELQNELLITGSSLEIYHGLPEQIFEQLMSKYDIKEVFTNDDYEPYAIERDQVVRNILNRKKILFKAYKDQVIFDKDEIIKDDHTPYTVFTPYSKRWKTKLKDFYLKPYPSEKLSVNFFNQSPKIIPSLESMGFKKTDTVFPLKIFSEQLISDYYLQRNFPAANGTSRLSVHLRFGTISIRELAGNAVRLNETFLNELIWRDFYQAILWHFPKVGNHKAFKPEYENIKWRNNEEEFARWCNGQTGYPIVDAGMRELNQTGFMHNRVRMIVASFLCKHLLIDWRWGEAYFAQKLLDFDLASNNGGWQWASGSGCDSAPYFRIFNPYLQTKKFDKDLIYIKKWVPEFQEFTYPTPIVEHEFARKRCLAVYADAIKNLH